MRVVHFCAKNDEVRTLRMAEWAKMLGHEVIVISGGVFADTPEPFIYRDDWFGIQRFKINHRLGDNDIAEGLIKMFRPDLLHLHEFTAALMALVRWSPRAQEAVHLEKRMNPREWIAEGAHLRRLPCKVILDHHEYDLHRARNYAHPGEWSDLRDFYTWIADAIHGETAPTQEIVDLLRIDVPNRPKEVVYNAGPRPPARSTWPDPRIVGCPDRAKGLKRILYSGNVGIVDRRLSWLRWVITDRGLKDRWNIGIATMPEQYASRDWPATSQLITYVPYATNFRPSPEFYASQANNDLQYVGGDIRFLTWLHAWPNKFSDAIFAGVPVLASAMVPVRKILEQFPSLGRVFTNLDDLAKNLVDLFDHPIKMREEERQAFIELCSYEDASGPALERIYAQAGIDLRKTKWKGSGDERGIESRYGSGEEGSGAGPSKPAVAASAPEPDRGNVGQANEEAEQGAKEGSQTDQAGPTEA